MSRYVGEAHTNSYLTKNIFFNFPSFLIRAFMVFHTENWGSKPAGGNKVLHFCLFFQTFRRFCDFPQRNTIETAIKNGLYIKLALDVDRTHSLLLLSKIEDIHIFNPTNLHQRGFFLKTLALCMVSIQERFLIKSGL